MTIFTKINLGQERKVKPIPLGDVKRQAAGSNCGDRLVGKARSVRGGPRRENMVRRMGSSNSFAIYPLLHLPFLLLSAPHRSSHPLQIPRPFP